MMLRAAIPTVYSVLATPPLSTATTPAQVLRGHSKPMIMVIPAKPMVTIRKGIRGAKPAHTELAIKAENE